MPDLKFYDYSDQVKAAIDGIVTSWLHTWGNEVASQAKRNTSMEGWTNSERTSLRDSYRCVVDESKKVARIGTPLEQGYWEEFGTGEHADTAKNGGKEGRKDWWVYIPGQEPIEGKESTHYKDEMEAKAAVEYIKKEYGKTAYATNGRKPNYTLEKAFISVDPKAQRDLNGKIKGL